MALALGAVCAEPAKPPTQLATELASPDREVRREAGYELSRIGAAAKPALSALITALEDQDKQVWSYAVTAIANIGPDAREAIPALLRGLEMRRGRGFRERDRRQAVLRSSYALSCIGPVAIPALTQALESEDTGLRLGAARALAGMGPAARDTIKPLILNLSHADPDVRRETIEALAAIGADSIKPLIESLQWSDVKIREGSARALGEMGRAAKDALPALEQRLREEKDATVMSALLTALPRVGIDPQQMLAPLLAAALGEDAALRHAANNTLLTNPSLAERSASELSKKLNQGSTAERQRAGYLIGRMGLRAKAAMPALVQAAKANPKDPIFPEALAQMGPEVLPGLMEAMTEVRADGDGDWIFRAMQSMGPSAAKPLTEALQHKNPAVRAGAARALAGMPGAGAVVEPLLAAADDPEPTVRSAALRALVGARAPKTRLQPKLEAALADPNPDVKRAATAGLAALGSVERLGVDGLIALLQDPEPQSQRAAVDALGTMGEKAAPAVALLEAKLADPAMQPLVIETLGKIGPAAVTAAPRLVEIGQKGKYESRLLAFQALAGIGKASAPVALPAIWEAAKSGDRDLKLAGLQALAKTEPDQQKLLETLVASLRDESGRIRRTAAQGIRQFGDKAQAAAPALFAMLAADNDRPIALETLRAVKPRSVPDLIGALSHRDPGVRIFASDQLGQIGPAAAEAIAALQGLLQNQPPPVQDAARRALQKIAPPQGTS